MTTREIIHVATAGGSYSAFPIGKSLSLWATYRVILVADSSPDTTRYRGSVDDANGDTWLVYAGTTVPASENAYLAEWQSPVFEASTAGSGNNTVTVTVLDGVTPISNAKVSIFLGGLLVRVGYTNISGVALFLLDAASYTINVSLFGYTAVAGQALVVSGNMNANVAMTPIALAVASPAGLCTVRFIVYESDGYTPLAGAIVAAKLNKNSAVDTILLSTALHSGVTDSNGICDLTLVQGTSIIKGSKYYLITVYAPSDTDLCDPISSYRAIVPATTTANAEDLLSA